MTTIPANARLLEGYVGPCEVDCGPRAGRLAAIVGDAWFGHGQRPSDGEYGTDRGPVPPKSIRLNLSHPIAFSHVLRLVAEAVGLDARGGVVLRAHVRSGMSTVWSLHGQGRAWWFSDDASGCVDLHTYVPNLPASPDAYLEALAAIAAVVLEEGR